MKQYLEVSKRFLLLFTPLLASSVIAALPSQAATLALSTGQLLFTNFSQTPLSTLTFTNTNTEVISQGGQLGAIADAQAIFTITPPEGFNSSSSLVEGVNNDYSGLAESEAILSANFSVEAGEPFSFDFTYFLDLQTSIDTPLKESATAIGNTFWVLLDTDDNKILDFFNLTGNLFTVGNNDFIEFNNSQNVAISNQEIESNFGGNEEFITIFVQGSLQRYFADTKNIALVEFKSNEVAVTVAEPSPSVTLLIFGSAIGIALKRRHKRKIVSFSL